MRKSTAAVCVPHIACSHRSARSAMVAWDREITQAESGDSERAEASCQFEAKREDAPQCRGRVQRTGGAHVASPLGLGAAFLPSRSSCPSQRKCFSPAAVLQRGLSVKFLFPFVTTHLCRFHTESTRRPQPAESELPLLPLSTLARDDDSPSLCFKF